MTVIAQPPQRQSPVPTTSLTAAQRAAHCLRERIVRAEIVPGARLGETELARSLQVSRNSLREAFATLEAERLVVRWRHRGVFVASPSRAEVAEMFRTRRAVQLSALRLGADPADRLEELTRIASTITYGMTTAHASVLREASDELHALIGAQLGSEDLDEVLRSVLCRLRLVVPPIPAWVDLHLRAAEREAVLVHQMITGDRSGAHAVLGDYLNEAECIALDVFTRSRAS
ncbi:MAG: GntR family transcriptional regulator [Micrococcus sp.]|nr:GntR family transcriptional regulator [Micrococcus sp.]